MCGDSEIRSLRLRSSLHNSSRRSSDRSGSGSRNSRRAAGGAGAVIVQYEACVSEAASTAAVFSCGHEADCIVIPSPSPEATTLYISFMPFGVWKLA
ncbi:MAG: hypothetical protein ACI90V_003671 [Bacillariaceae sp.]|jgi:hypothetical protein